MLSSWSFVLAESYPCLPLRMQLFFREYGAGAPLIILHGLLGSSDNWFTQARAFEKNYHVYLVDQRNHGQSPHSEDMDYTLLADDLQEFIGTHHLERPVIIGHSMGGKTAMQFTITRPDKVRALVVVDIAPKYYPVHHDAIVHAMKSISLEQIKSRADADTLLSDKLKGPAVRQFVLKNLTRTDAGSYQWRVNLDVIERNLEKIGAAITGGRYEGPTLFVRGSLSSYVEDGDWPEVLKLFPHARLVTLPTDHWVQAEQPKLFAENVLDFLKAIP